MSLHLAVVSSVTATQSARDDFLTFAVKLIPSSQKTYASMAWKSTAKGLFDTVYEFTNGVTIDQKTGFLIIPPNIKEFSVSRKISSDDDLDLILDPEFYVNDVAARDVDGESPIIEGVTPSSPWVKLSTNRRLVNEGENLIFNVAIVKRAKFYSVALTGNTADVALRLNWKFTNGVRFNADRSRLIVPANVKNFQIYIPTRKDNVNVEPLDRVNLTIGGSRLKLLIQDFPVAKVTSLSASQSVYLEGRKIEINVGLSKKNTLSSVAVGLTGNTKDVEQRWRWSFTNNVRWNSDYSRLIIPKNVTNFKIFIDTIADSIHNNNGQKTNLMVGGKVTSLAIREINLRRIVSFGLLSIVGGPTPIITDRVSEGSLVVLPITLEPGRIIPNTYFKIDLGGSAVGKYSPQIISAVDFSHNPSSRLRFTHLGDGLFLISPSMRTGPIQIGVRIQLGSKPTFSGRGQLIIKGSNPSATRTFIVDDNHTSVVSAFSALDTNFTRGYAGFTRAIPNILSYVRTDQGHPFLDGQLKHYEYLVRKNLLPIFKKNREMTVRSFVQKVQFATDVMRERRMNDARTLLAFAYADLNPPNYTSGGTTGTVLTNALNYLNRVNERIKMSLEKALIVRQIFADLIGSTDPSNSLDQNWFNDKNKPVGQSIGDLWDEYYKKFNVFFDEVVTTFDEIRVNFSETRNIEKERIMNIILAACAGFAALGSVGFLVSNLRATWGQVAAAITNTNQRFATASQFFKFGLNGPAAGGSVTLGINNLAAMVVSTLRSLEGGIAGLGKFDGAGIGISEQFDKNSELLVNQLARFEEKYLDMMHFILINGGAGDDDEFIKTDFVSQFAHGQYPTKGRSGFVNVPGYVYAWWSEPYESSGDTGIAQDLWGIRAKPDQNVNNVKVWAPVVLDMAGHGLKYLSVSEKAIFDADHDGNRDRTAWIGDGTALLTFDVDGDGDITATNEISFLSYKEGSKTDLEGLVAFDSNGNSLLDEGDALWHRFGVWQDHNADGLVQKGERLSLDQAGIASISLISDRIASQIHDVYVYGHSHFMRIDGSQGVIGDVGFRYRA